LKKLILFLLVSNFILGQNNSPIRSGSPNVYIDCGFCDLNYFKEQISAVNIVRDRKESDIHILFSRQRTGSAGIEYTLFFIGLGNYSGMNDTIKFTTNQTDTEDLIREKTARYIKMGLVRYIAKSEVADRINITFTKPQVEAAPAKDDWNYWYFRASLFSYFNGQKSNDFINLNSSVSANRVTDDSKINFQISNSYNESNFSFGSTKIKSISRSQNFRSYYIWAIDNHWSWGIWARAFRSTYSNIDYSLSMSPGIEFNVFPYSMSNQKQFRFEYRIEPNLNRYVEETIFLKKKELLWNQALEMTYTVIEPWGNIEVNVEGANYLHDFNKYQIEIWSTFSVNLVKGLSLNFSGGYSKILNQVALPRGGASLEEVLLQRRELETQYSYWGNVGISYSFGSVYNNIVNSRFGN
jgi:hypothetical protein